ncbi:hypothetical protein J4461_00575 [Candidatus Pacearchaeota archaeon]|nr:hypothetical protein [Candidatus Pacearchaeota archaeon]
METYTKNLSTNDPEYTAKYATIQSLNQMSDKIRENKSSMYSKVYYGSSLIFGVLIAIFANSLNWLVVFLLIDLSLALLIFFAKKFH